VKLLTLAFTMLFVLAFIGSKQGMEVTAVCGPSASTPLIMKGDSAAEKLGKAVRRLRGDPSPLDVYLGLKGMFDVFELWAFSAKAGFLGAPPPAKTLREKMAAGQQRAILDCCVNLDAPASNPGVKPASSVMAVNLGPTERWTAAQRSATATYIKVANTYDIPMKGAVIATAVSLVEYRPMTNPAFGDRDSQGNFQQRPSQGWGTVDEVRDLVLATKAFYGVARHTNNPGLVDIANWQRRPMGEVAQAVQRSGFPGRYAPVMDEARALVASISPSAPGTPPSIDPPKDENPADPPTVTSPTCTPATKAEDVKPKNSIVSTSFDLVNRRTPAQAIEFLMSRYVNPQRPIEVNACLHYMALAYGYPTTKKVDGNWYAIDVYHQMPARLKHAESSGTPPRGALVFWETGSAAGHIAISTGDGNVLTTDAPDRGRIGIVPLKTIDKWGPRVGWTEPYFAGQTKTGVRT
jgi:hypothetical protein